VSVPMLRGSATLPVNGEIWPPIRLMLWWWAYVVYSGSAA
jgi:hypothetical protein